MERPGRASMRVCEGTGIYEEVVKKSMLRETARFRYVRGLDVQMKSAIASS